MNPEWLAQLEDIVLPDPVGWWPLSINVWVTLITLIIILTALIWYLLQRHKSARYRREANQQLKQLRQLDDSELLKQLNQLLKQVAMTAYGRQSCAGLDQQAWLMFLKSKAAFLQQPQALERLQQRYQINAEPLTEPERAALFYYAEHWIKGHHL